MTAPDDAPEATAYSPRLARDAPPVASVEQLALEALCRRAADALLVASYDTVSEVLGDLSRTRLQFPELNSEIRALSKALDRGLFRVRSSQVVHTMSPDSARFKILKHLAGHDDSTGAELAHSTGLSEEHVSRIGPALESDGLVVRSRLGRTKRWQLTPAGRHAIEGTLTRSREAGPAGTLDNNPATPQAAKAEAARLALLLEVGEVELQPIQISGDRPNGDAWTIPYATTATVEQGDRR